ncbi:hypothetical protein DL96DRAFT_1622213 [Flagelloscypha sp. PMI_526]|nr:hypothetical protein DL96DRAFT_1622213 [Flagelloscypha sp. PMI_526]
MSLIFILFSISSSYRARLTKQPKLHFIIPSTSQTPTLFRSTTRYIAGSPFCRNILSIAHATPHLSMNSLGCCGTENPL